MNPVQMLEVKFNLESGSSAIYPAILRDEQKMILVDCGYPHFLPRIKRAAETVGVNLDYLTKIVITHHDFDHIGALKDFKEAYPNISIVASEIEEKFISGKEKSLRLQQAEALYGSLPAEQQTGARNFQNMLRSIKPVEVDLFVKDHDKFSWCGGTEIIATPGHMPGHICLYVQKSKTLITGDALVIEDNELAIANPIYTLDMTEAKRSIKKLLDYDIEHIICYHGGSYTGDIKASLEKLI